MTEVGYAGTAVVHFTIASRLCSFDSDSLCMLNAEECPSLPQSNMLFVIFLGRPPVFSLLIESYTFLLTP